MKTFEMLWTIWRDVQVPKLTLLAVRFSIPVTAVVRIGRKGSRQGKIGRCGETCLDVPFLIDCPDRIVVILNKIDCIAILHKLINSILSTSRKESKMAVWGYIPKLMQCVHEIFRCSHLIT